MMLDVAFKDLRRLLSNPFNLVMMLGAPFMITGLIYFAFGGLGSNQDEYSLQPVQAVIVNQDKGSSGFNAGAQLEQFLLGDAVADILEPSTAGDESAARALVDEQQADVAVLIPPDFSEKAIGGNSSAEVVLYQDPTLTLAPAILKSLVSQFTDSFAGATIATRVVQDQLSARGQPLDEQELPQVAFSYAGGLQGGDHEHSNERPVGLVIHATEAAGSEQDPSAFIAPVMASMMIFSIFFMGANGAENIIVESEAGTLARLFTTPNSRAMILGGKLLAVMLTLILQTMVLILSASLLFSIDWGSPMSIMLTSLSMIAAAGGFGMMMMSFLENTRQTGPVLGGVLTVMAMLGGLFTNGIPNLPAEFDKVSLSMPQGWALQAWKVTLSGAPVVEVLSPNLVLIAMGLGFFTIGAFFFRRRFA